MYTTKNISEADKELLARGFLLPVMEQFYTIQGEGYNTGKAAYFIRIGGCDVGCHWCDVKESWDASIHPLTSIEHVIDSVNRAKAQSVVITGGEPLSYNLQALTARLKEKNVETFIETSGAYPLSGQWDWICLSPKKTAPSLPSIYPQANELKIIVHNRHDLLWAEQEAQKVSKTCYLFLQPEWSKRDEITPLLVDYVKERPRWIISLQTHKYMNIP